MRPTRRCVGRPQFIRCRQPARDTGRRRSRVEYGACQATAPVQGKRQRGIRSNGATEYQLHCAVVDIIRRGIYTHIASGEKRDQATAARLKGTGVVGGFPDLMFFGIKGEVCCVELNAEGGRLSES